MPDTLTFLELSLCIEHIQHLLSLREGLLLVTSSDEYVEHGLLDEARALVYPIRGVPRLTVLEGGA